LAFISSVSKQLNSLCNKHKQQLGIDLVKVEQTKFPQNFARNGFLNCMVYAHENGCSWNEDTCSYAALNGHLDCLEYAHENGCPWDEWTCSEAALGGHLDCLIFAHKNGCPWDKYTRDNAAVKGHWSCVAYADRM
jgi:hypothetical protein